MYCKIELLTEIGIPQPYAFYAAFKLLTMFLDTGHDLYTPLPHTRAWEYKKGVWPKGQGTSNGVLHQLFFR